MSFLLLWTLFQIQCNYKGLWDGVLVCVFCQWHFTVTKVMHTKTLSYNLFNTYYLKEGLLKDWLSVSIEGSRYCIIGKAQLAQVVKYPKKMHAYSICQSACYSLESKQVRLDDWVTVES